MLQHCPIQQKQQLDKMEGLTSVKASSWDVTMKSICAKLHFWSIAEWKRKSTSSTRASNPVTKESNEVVELPSSTQNGTPALKSNAVSLAYPNCDLAIWLRSCEKEVVTPLEGITTGTIPIWISGSLYRNGPGKQRYGRQTVNHLFDASGLLHL